MADRKQGDYYSRWYAKNKDARNARRREQYDSDDEYRTRELDRREEYAKRKEGMPKPKAGRLFRTLKGAEVEVYRIGDVAAWCETAAEVIRNYEKRGIIPAPLLSGTHRLYTDRQCELISEVVEFMRESRYRGQEVQVERKLLSLKKRVQKEWSQTT